ncbi:MAG: hypothetical protein GY945_05205 [Rhodobacteraceae bacterium]|nr:hypothetical protein [Paracoccaceae bacterium]
MKPNFALNLSHDGIGLFHRTNGSKDGWTLIGQVALDDDELGTKLAILRKTAADLEKGGVATKLIIPNSQILYTEVEAPGPDDITREVQIRAGLEGLTPYDVGELVFDWRKGKGNKVMVAVLARETLSEAEQFAKEHRFNPVSFVARPNNKGFKGEAFFGKATGAAALLGAGERIEPDQKAVPDLKVEKPDRSAKAQQPPEKSPPEEPKVAPAKTADIPLAGKDDGPDAGEKAAKKTGATPSDAAAESTVEPATKPVKASPKPTAKETASKTEARPDTAQQTAQVAQADTETLTGPQEDDARIEALLAEVAEPEAKEPEPDTSGDQKKPQNPAKSKARAKSAAKSADNQPPAPVLAPFPPTPEAEDDEPTPFMPSPPPPPPRRQLPTGLHVKTSVPKPATRVVTPSGSNPFSTPPSKSAQKVEPGPAAAFSSRRSGDALAGKSTAALGGSTRKQKRRFSLTESLSTIKSSTGSVAGIATKIAARRPAAGKSPQGTSPSLTANKGGSSQATSGDGPGAINSLFTRATSGAQELLNRAKTTRAAPVVNGADKASGNNDTRPVLPDPTPKPKPTAKPLMADRAHLGKTGQGKTGLQATPVTAKPNPDQLTPLNIAKPADSEADRLTMFGARKSQNPDIGGKPKYLGLVLILILLLVMAVTALSSVFFFSDSSSLFGRGDENEFAAAAVPEITTTIAGTDVGNTPAPPRPTAPQTPATGDAGSGETAPVPSGQGDQAALDQITTDLMNDAEPEPEPELPSPTPDETTETMTATTTAPQNPLGLSEDTAQSHYAATGIWQKAPDPLGEPQSSRIDELYVASIDPAISSQDAVALPSGSATAQEARPATPLPPPEAGTSFAFDDRGLVTPTPEGTLSPDGILIYSGKPPIVPDPRPGTAPVPATIAPDVLQGFRPHPRPASLIEDNERANLGGATLAELAVLRAPVRPASLQAQAQAEAGADTAPNELAIAASPTPGYRPGNFSTIVERARENADASDGSVVVAASAAAVTVPSIPTRASVATQATINNALSLNRINLIGIYGSSTDRRALVRLSSGRYVKVSVGDRLNGGKVVSITETRLIYTKSGRNKTLDILPLG